MARHAGPLRRLRDVVEVGAERDHRLPRAPRREPRRRDPGVILLHRESVLAQQRDDVLRGLELLEAELAEAEDLVHHLLSELRAAVDVVAHLALEPRETVVGRGGRRLLGGERGGEHEGEQDGGQSSGACGSSRVGCGRSAKLRAATCGGKTAALLTLRSRSRLATVFDSPPAMHHAAPRVTSADTRFSPAAAPRWLVVTAFAAVYVLWGSTYLAIRYAIETIPPFLMAGARFLVAGGVLYRLGALARCRAARTGALALRVRHRRAAPRAQQWRRHLGRADGAERHHVAHRLHRAALDGDARLGVLRRRAAVRRA